MTLTRTKTELQGKLSEVVEAISVEYPSVGLMTKEIIVCMLTTSTDKLEFSTDLYDKLVDVEIKLSTDGDKVYIEILKEEKEDDELVK